MIRGCLVTLLIVHGVAHFPGFAVPWRLLQTDELPYRTTILAGSFNLGERGIQAVGLAWAAVGIAFIALAVLVWLHSPRAPNLVGAAIIVSLLLCVIGWPDSRIGILVNVLMLGLLVASSR